MFDLQLHQLIKMLHFFGAEYFEKNFGGKNGTVFEVLDCPPGFGGNYLSRRGLFVLAGNYLSWREYANLCSNLAGK